ncbi:hypothetical protein FLAV_01218 [Flavobacteriales bacterium]|nr:hypothetical protein FLAV_01218 [Flavobacteriales bacterium]
MVSVEIDSEVNAMYIRFKKGKVDKSEPLADNVIIDIDKNGKAIGIEILLPKEELRVLNIVSDALKVEA